MTQVQSRQRIGAAQVRSEHLKRATGRVNPSKVLATGLLAIVRNLARADGTGAIEVQNGQIRNVFEHILIVKFNDSKATQIHLCGYYLV
jgi:hypothetical protein